MGARVTFTVFPFAGNFPQFVRRKGACWRIFKKRFHQPQGTVDLILSVPWSFHVCSSTNYFSVQGIIHVAVGVIKGAKQTKLRVMLSGPENYLGAFKCLIEILNCLHGYS